MTPLPSVLVRLLPRGVARRFVAGEDAADAVAVARELAADGRRAGFEHCGADGVEQSLRLLAGLAATGLSADLTLRTTDLDDAARICAAARQADCTTTVDADDVDAGLELHDQLCRDFPDTGVALRASRERTEADCRALAGTGARVRLYRGAGPHAVDLRYVRCANALLAGSARPSFATPDPLLLRVLAERVRWFDRAADDHEYQLPFGIRPDEQRRLAAAGSTVRVHVPYGDQWYDRLAPRRDRG